MKSPQNLGGTVNNGQFGNLVDQYLLNQKGQDGTLSPGNYGLASTMPITRFNT
jgi:hypothetical protein